ncbi:YceD family protein, partial [Aurantimicrobium minutum]|uniref:YceD family protein n=1 Tax=Aurantimicrobium minutum TaxID=708131 RepID=UPI003CD0CAFC
MAKFIKTPFTIEVHDLMHRPGEHRERQLDVVAPEKMGEGIISVPAGENIHLDLRLESLGDGILVSAEIETTAFGECGRCLEPIEEDLELEFQELFAYSVDEAFDYEV